MVRPSLFRPFLVLVILASLPLAAATITVTNTNDSGPGSLRDALSQTGVGTYDRIHFSIGSGVQTIQPLTKLPTPLTFLTIDGTTQPGYSGSPLIEIDGALVAGSWSTNAGLEVVGEIKALVINNFIGPAIRMSGGTIRGCYLGTDPTGKVAKPNDFGVWVLGSGGDVTIGGASPADSNLISGNLVGVEVSSSSSVSIQGNTFGSDITQNFPLGVMASHVRRQTFYDTALTVGGVAPNVFVGSSTAIDISFGGGAAIIGNLIGVTPAGKIIPSQTAISMYRSNDNLVEGNTITGNFLGIMVTGDSLRNQFFKNSMEKNTFGIDLSDYSYDRPTPNDPGDGDTGPNNFINYPVLVRAQIQGPTIVTGTLSTAPNRTNRIDLFASPVCNASGFGEGRDFLDAFDVTTDASGQATFTRTLPWMAPGTSITATTTSSVEGTSEFSRCITVEGPGIFSFENAASNAFEGGTAVLNVHRRDGAVGAASVSYSLGTGTATPGTDFTGGSGTLSFGDGETLKTIMIPLINDSVYDAGETIAILLSGATNGTEIGAPTGTTITITDDDAPPGVTISTISVPEGDSGTSVAEVRFTLSSPAGAAYAISYYSGNYGASAGSDYVASSGTLTFLPGETEKVVPMTIIGDTLAEGNETFYLTLSSSPWSTGYVTIVDDDEFPTVSVQNLEITEGDSPSTAIVTIVASAPIYGQIGVSLQPVTAQAPGDFTPWSGSLNFENQTTRTFAVSIAGDDEPEPNETFRVVVQYRWGNFTVGQSGETQGTVTILNDDVGVGPSQRSIATGQTGAFTVRLGSVQPQNITLSVSSDAPEAVSVPATLVIPAGAIGAELEAAALLPDRSATIRVTFPPSLGGVTHSVRVDTYAKATLRFTPSRLEMFEGQTADVSVSVDPSSIPTTIGLSAIGSVQVPSSVTIPAGGTATFTAKAIGKGALTINATLPSIYGSEVQSLYGDVRTAPVTPAILSITPSHGPTSGGTSITVSGAHFRAGCGLLLGGAPAPTVKIGSAATMTALTPPHVQGTVDVLLVCGSDSFTFRNGFGYISEAPHLSEVRPSKGTTGGGTQVAVIGSHFDSSCWPSFGPNKATHVIAVDATTLIATTPPSAAPGTFDVTLRCSGGTDAIPSAFEYHNAQDPAPLISTISPSAAAPGEWVTIAGFHFRPDHKVTFEATSATIIRTFPDSLIVVVPGLPAGTSSVLVTDTLGRTTTSGPLFSVLEARPPRINTITPSSSPAGGELELNGEGFRPGYTFQIGGYPATLVTSDYTRAVVRISPDAMPGSHTVDVRNSAGALATRGPAVSIVAGGMTLRSVDPRCAATSGGVFGTIRGRGFTTGLAVTFDGIPATDISLVDATTLRLRIPAGSAGPARVVVTDGTRTAALSNGFTYDSPFAPRTSCSGRSRSMRP